MADTQRTRLGHRLGFTLSAALQTLLKNVTQTTSGFPPRPSRRVRHRWLHTPAVATSLLQGSEGAGEAVSFVPRFSSAFLPGHTWDAQGSSEGGEGLDSVVAFDHLLCRPCFSC